MFMTSHISPYIKPSYKRWKHRCTSWSSRVNWNVNASDCLNWGRSTISWRANLRDGLKRWVVVQWYRFIICIPQIYIPVIMFYLSTPCVFLIYLFIFQLYVMLFWQLLFVNDIFHRLTHPTSYKPILRHYYTPYINILQISPIYTTPFIMQYICINLHRHTFL